LLVVVVLVLGWHFRVESGGDGGVVVVVVVVVLVVVLAATGGVVVVVVVVVMVVVLAVVVYQERLHLPRLTTHPCCQRVAAPSANSAPPHNSLWVWGSRQRDNGAAFFVSCA
jgi:hypothetical protein